MVIDERGWAELSEAWARLDGPDQQMVVDVARGLRYLRDAVRDNDVEDLVQVHVDVRATLVDPGAATARLEDLDGGGTDVDVATDVSD